ncbi:S41 family peptidase [Pyxidicoccus parkwayensis]|uniref:S41 family peptidase n=1 Tax=Pyxidicoccus parkwayensis TaxID=2813578 RepID=A0ABX7P9A7_9BACT|nr:S41 family peptidase [Pyxidicoccus parkwaysis]QSQ27099.1 S41 family peptidase [Pyxidicoccus parkwaysis]
MRHLDFLFAAAFVLGAGLAGCASSSVGVRPASSGEPELLLKDGTTPEAARGVWRSLGYGLVLTVTPDGLKLHHETSAGCYADPGGEDSLLTSLVYLVPGTSPDELTVVSDPGETEYLFKRIPALPPACAASVTWTPPRLFDVFAATFTEQYAFFPEHHVDWKARVAANRPRVTDATDARALFDVFTDMLTGVEDAHLGLAAEIDGEEHSFSAGEGITTRRLEERARKAGLPEREAKRGWLRAYRDGILHTVLQDTGHHVANQRIIHGRVGDLGYLNVLTMGGFVEGAPTLAEESVALKAALDEALTSFQGARAVIVDVSNNRGGYDAVARDIAARFAEARHLAYTKRPRAAAVAPQPFYVEPARGPRFTGPVYLVTSDVTVSAGEVFTLCMRALPNVTHVGTTTRGAFSDVIVKPLPNAWRMELSSEVYLDPKGILYEAQGIPPTRPLEIFPESDLDGGHTKAVLSLMELARQQTPEPPRSARADAAEERGPLR